MRDTFLFLMARPRREFVEAILRALAIAGLDRELGDTLFPTGNWHQSLTNRLPDHPEVAAALVRAGAHVDAAAVEMPFDRIASVRGERDINWRVEVSGKRPPGFDSLLHAVQNAMTREHVRDGGDGHAPHVTISYWAPHTLSSARRFPTVNWSLDEVELVRAGGDPHLYTTLARWPLRAAEQQAPHQTGLFST